MHIEPLKFYYCGSRLVGDCRDVSDLDCLLYWDEDFDPMVFNVPFEDTVINFCCRKMDKIEKLTGNNFFRQKYILPLFSVEHRKLMNLCPESCYRYIRDKGKNVDYRLEKSAEFFADPKPTVWFEENWERAHKALLKHMTDLLNTPEKKYLRKKFKNTL